MYFPSYYGTKIRRLQMSFNRIWLECWSVTYPTIKNGFHYFENWLLLIELIKYLCELSLNNCAIYEDPFAPRLNNFERIATPVDPRNPKSPHPNTCAMSVYTILLPRYKLKLNFKMRINHSPKNGSHSGVVVVEFSEKSVRYVMPRIAGIDNRRLLHPHDARNSTQFLHNWFQFC